MILPEPITVDLDSVKIDKAITYVVTKPGDVFDELARMDVIFTTRSDLTVSERTKAALGFERLLNGISVAPVFEEDDACGVQDGVSPHFC